MLAGVRLGGPEKRTGPLRVMVPPGAGCRVYGLEKRMRAGVRLGGPKNAPAPFALWFHPEQGSACRGAFRGARKTHRPLRVVVPPGAGFRVYGLEKRMRAGVRLGEPEKRTGPLRVMVPPGAGFRAQGLEKRMRGQWKNAFCHLLVGSWIV